MSETLGEKLRKARENRGISISQVSEQTRIASHFLSAIEENDYSTLPGGIFNKGFVKSFAKCVGVSEQEALADYNALMASTEPDKDADELYSPEVLTDDNAAPSMVSTVVLIVLILAVLIGGLILAIYWISGEGDASVQPNVAKTPPVSAPAEAAGTPVEGTPMPDVFTVEIFAKDKIVEFGYESDGEKVPVKVLKPGEVALSLQVRDSFKGSFYRTVVPAVGLRLNGQEICLNKPRGTYLDITITKDRVPEIIAAKCYGDAEAEEEIPRVPNANQAVNSAPAAAGNSNRASNAARPAANSVRPTSNSARPASNTARPAANRPSAPRPRISPTN